jgi:hypothetical protein
MMSHYLEEDASAIEQADYELKRVDHLIYVSLKYTRTVDVIKNIIDRLIATYDNVWDDFLIRAERERKIFEIPKAPGAKCAIIKRLWDEDEKILEFVQFYLHLRQFNQAEYTAHKEFRRHVSMKAIFTNGETHELNIDIITEYYNRTKEFLEFVRTAYFTEE